MKPNGFPYLIALAVLALGALATGTVIGAPSRFQEPDPTNQQAMLETAVQQRLRATATRQAELNATRTAEAAATDFEATLRAAVEQAATATRLAAAGPTMTAVAARTRIREFEGVEMVLVPAGCFTMGSTQEEVETAFQQCEQEYGTGNCNRDSFGVEVPAHEQCFDEPFWIDRTEVTNRQFARLRGEAATPSYWTGDDRPRESISWFEAYAFCELRGARLPTEAEWEYAARGPDNLIYPWGNTWEPDNAVWWGNSGSETADVGSRPWGESWVGALDLSGNVWEWVSSVYAAYPYESSNERGADRNSFRVLRGGSWYSYGSFQYGAHRFQLSPYSGINDVGFRCARSYSES